MPKIQVLDNVNWKLLGSLHKPTRYTAISRFVPIVRLKSSSLNIHELTATDRHELDSFPALSTINHHQ